MRIEMVVYYSPGLSFHLLESALVDGWAEASRNDPSQQQEAHGPVVVGCSCCLYGSYVC